MAFPTKIGFCHATFSPWYGCTKISPGCEHCFAERWAKRTGIVEWGPGKARRLASEHAWRQPVIWNERAAKAGTRYRVLTDLCDVFDDTFFEWTIWHMMFMRLVIKTPHLDWLVLTKRPLKAKSLGNEIHFPSNVWPGVSVCTQAEADEKIPILLSIPASKHWVSVEPMLEAINLTKIPKPDQGVVSANVLDRHGYHQGIKWIVCGGETGSGARPVHPDWVRSLRDRCQEAGVAFWFKSWGEWLHASQFASLQIAKTSPKSYHWLDGSFSYRWGHKSAGNLLDGRKWEQVPK